MSINSSLLLDITRHYPIIEVSKESSDGDGHLLGARPTERVQTVDDFSVNCDKLAGDELAYAGTSKRTHKGTQDRERECFYCLSGWVFLGSLDYDGQEVFDAVRCRRCGGTGRISL